jgi:hypothetical protein
MRNLMIAAAAMAAFAAPAVAGVPASFAAGMSTPTQLNCLTTRPDNLLFGATVQNRAGPALGTGSQIVVFGAGDIGFYHAGSPGLITNPITITLIAPLPVGGRVEVGGSQAKFGPKDTPACKAFVSVAKPIDNFDRQRTRATLALHR